MDQMYQLKYLWSVVLHLRDVYVLVDDFFRFSKKSGFGVFLVHPPMASVLLSALVKRCFISRMRDFFKKNNSLGWVITKLRRSPNKSSSFRPESISKLPGGFQYLWVVRVHLSCVQILATDEVLERNVWQKTDARTSACHWTGQNLSVVQMLVVVIFNSTLFSVQFLFIGLVLNDYQTQLSQDFLQKKQLITYYLLVWFVMFFPPEYLKHFHAIKYIWIFSLSVLQFLELHF